MRKLRRLPLSNHATGFLADRTKAVGEDANPVSKARKLWKYPKTKALQEVMRKLRFMAPGIDSCMYCERNEGTDIEHFKPKSIYPEKAFDWDNYLLACSNCNSNYKRSRFPLDPGGKPLLLDPIEDDPFDHLFFSPGSGKVKALRQSEKGFKSIRVYGLDRLDRSRKDAWVSLKAGLKEYGRAMREQRFKQAQDQRQALCRAPFSSQLAYLLKITQDTRKTDVFIRAGSLDEECLEVLTTFPGIADWLTVFQADATLILPLRNRTVSAVEVYTGRELEVSFESLDICLYFRLFKLQGFQDARALTGKTLTNIDAGPKQTRLVFEDDMEIIVSHAPRYDGTCETMFLLEGEHLKGVW